jgi:3',5'-cyclic-AMP phosphodiesterase
MGTSESDRAAGDATILQLADIHMRADDGEVYGQNPERRLALVLEACERELAAVDLVVLTGDQSDDGDPQALERLRQILAGIGAPILAVPGNHDGPDLQRAAFGDWMLAEPGGWRVVGLDSSVPGEIHGSVDVGALESLLDGLDERPTVLLVHHPPVPPTSHPWFRIENAESLLASLAARPQVRAVLSGHAHFAFAFGRGRLQLLGGPSTLAPFSFPDDELLVGAGGPVGARALSLGEDGSLESRLIEA